MITSNITRATTAKAVAPGISLRRAASVVRGTIELIEPVQIVELGATVSDLVNMAALAAHDAIG